MSGVTEFVRLRNVSGHPYHLGAACVRVEAGACLDLPEDACPSLIRDCRIAFDAGALAIVDLDEEAPALEADADPNTLNVVHPDEVDEDPTEEVEPPK